MGQELVKSVDLTELPAAEKQKFCTTFPGHPQRLI